MPTFAVSNLSPDVGEDVVFTADPARILEADPSWDLGNGVHLRGNPLVYRYANPGTYRVVLTATESGCGTTRISEPQFLRVVDVDHACPRDPQPSCGDGTCGVCERVNCPQDCLPTCGNRSCDAGEDCSNCAIDCGYQPTFTFGPPSPVTVGEELTFTAEPALISDPNPSWDLGNGVHIRGRSIVYSYPTSGLYSVRLTATEAGCGSTQISHSRRIEVRDRAVRRGDDATLLASNLPSCLRPGETYRAILTLRNTGITTWGIGYNLGAVGDSDPLAAGTRVGLTRPVLTLEDHTFSFDLTAPGREGRYVTDWQMVHEGVAWFGDVARQVVNVSSACRPPPSGELSYGCSASIRDVAGSPVPDVEVRLDALVLEPEAPPRAVAHAVGRTDQQGRVSIAMASPVAQQLRCEAHGIRTTTPRVVFATDPVLLPDGTVLDLDLTTVPDFVDRAVFPGLKAGSAVGRLYQSGPYDKPVVIPSPFDAGEQTADRRTEATFFALFEPFIVPANALGLDIWLIKTKTGQNIHEQAAELAQAIDFAAWRLGPEGKVIVAGYSLGGVVARLATARYEADAPWRSALGVQDELPVSLIVFGDAPLAGAHINLCLQRGIWDLPGDRQSEANLNSCGGQQLLETSVSGLGRVQFHTTNWRSFYERGESVYLTPDGVCDRQGIAPDRLTPDPHDGVPACVCDAGPAVLSVNGDGWAHGPDIIAFSDGTPGPMMCYGDERDEGRDGVRVCLPSRPPPHELRVGDLLYKVRLPFQPDPPLCLAEPADVRAGSRVAGDLTKVVGLPPLPAGGVEQFSTGAFIPYDSALPPGAPFFDVTDNTFQGVHGTGYEPSFCWALEHMTGVPCPLFAAPPSVPAKLAVSPADPRSGRRPVIVTFPEGTEEGTTTLYLRDTGPAPWPGHVLGDPTTYYELTTTANHRASSLDPITVCIDYGEVSFMNEVELALVQLEPEGWVDRTSLRDRSGKLVCGNVIGLGLFAIVEPANATPSVDAGPDQIVEAAGPAGAAVTLNGSATFDPDGEAFEIEWRDEGGQLVAGTIKSERPFGLGVHRLTLYARDRRGGIGEDTVEIEVRDTVPPEAALTTPEEGATVRGEIRLEANVWDSVEMGGVRFEVDGVRVGEEVTTPPYATVWNTSSVADGLHQLRAVAEDGAGNVTVSMPIGVRVENRCPGQVEDPTGCVVAACEGGLSQPTVRLGWCADARANVNSVQKGDSYPSDPGRFWAYILQQSSPPFTYELVDGNISPGQTYSYRIKYQPSLISATVQIPIDACTCGPGEPGELVADPGGPYSARVGEPIAFDGSGSTPADGIAFYNWDFGDLSTDVGARAEHTYREPGTYRVTLTVLNDIGLQASAVTQAVVVAAPPPQPVAVTWRDVEGLIVDGSSLRKPGQSWDQAAGASSVERCESGECALRWTITYMPPNTKMAVGLSHGDDDQSLVDIDHAIVVDRLGKLEARHSGGAGQAYAGTVGVGDRLGIDVAGGEVSYLVNGSVFSTVAAAPSFPLLVDTSFRVASGSVGGVRLNGDPVTWENVQGALLKDDGSLGAPYYYSWQSGAASNEAIDAGDGYLEWTSEETAGAKLAGLSSGLNLGVGPSDIDFAIKLNNGAFDSDPAEIEILEYGTSRGSFGTFEAGDALRVAVVDGSVQYLHNGALLYTSARAPHYPLYADTSIHTFGKTLSDFVMASSDSRPPDGGRPVSWVDAQGVLVSGSSLVKPGRNWQVAGGASSVEICEAGDCRAEWSVETLRSQKAIGLSHGDTDRRLRDIDFALRIDHTGEVAAVENGERVATAPGNIAVGDRLAVEVRDGEVLYLVNGEVFAASTQRPAYPLSIDTAFLVHSGAIGDVRLDGAAVTWKNVHGVYVDPQGLLRVPNNYEWSGARAQESLSADGGYIELTTGENTGKKAAGLSAGAKRGYRAADIDFAIVLSKEGAIVTEAGTAVSSTVAFEAGDRFRIEVDDGEVRYLHNGALLHVSSEVPQLPLYPDAAISQWSRTIESVELGPLNRN